MSGEKELEHRMNTVERAIEKISDSMAILVRLETEHLETRRAIGRAFKSIEEHEDRIREIEIAVPPLKETRRLVIGALILIACAVGGIVLDAVFHRVESKEPPAIVAPSEIPH